MIRKTIVSFALSLSVGSAFAQENSMHMIAAQGNWIAFQHSAPSGIDVDICGAGSLDKALFFRADANEFEIRSSDSAWSMTTGQQGDVTISAGGYKKTFSMTAGNDTMLAAEVDSAELSSLLSALDKSASATVTYGKKTTKRVSLAGSTKVLNSFRACVASSEFGDLGKAAGPSNSPF